MTQVKRLVTRRLRGRDTFAGCGIVHWRKKLASLSESRFSPVISENFLKNSGFGIGTIHDAFWQLWMHYQMPRQQAALERHPVIAAWMEYKGVGHLTWHEPIQLQLF